MANPSLSLLASLLLITACSGDNTPEASFDAGVDLGDPSSRPNYSANWDRDILSYDLQIDLAARTGVVTLVVAGSDSTGLSLDVGNLDILSVTDSFGELKNLDLGRELLIGVPAKGVSRRITIGYSFLANTNFNGWDDEKNLSFLWPTFCGNLYPCNPAPSEGATYTLSVTGTPEGASGVLVYPSEIPAQAPSYMPAISFGSYTELSLGTTPAGTEVSVWYEEGQLANAQAGTAHLLAAFEFFETTYGPYRFGKKVGTVSVNWGQGDFGGMEHHPYWHVSSGSLADEETNVHEAAHGWFGNGVRIACWEDFVLSEGVVTYMAARALEESGVDLWAEYDCQLAQICRGGSNTTALLTGCDEIDLLTHPLWSSVPYQKGAQYLREVSALIGQDLVDEALSEFYQANVEKAVHMRELVTLLKSKGESAQIEALTVQWLESESCPMSVNALCPR